MKIAFDIDGVLYPFHESLYTELVAFHNLHETFDEFWSEGYKKLSELNFNYFINLLHIYESMIPNEDIIYFLKMVNKKHEIFYITSRPDSLKRLTKKYFNKYEFPSSDNLYFCSDKSLIIRRFDLALLIDDQLKYLEQCKNYCTCYLIKRPYNKEGRDLYPSFHSVLELKELL